MDSSNRIVKVAVVGAGGNSGSYITRALLETGKHIVTAITRTDSETVLPDGVVVKKVDYTRPDTLVEALRGQDALVITLSGHALTLQTKLIAAAAEAGVAWILPNEWSPDSANEALVKDVPLFQTKVTDRKAITDLGKSSYIAMCTGFWYQWSLAVPTAFGFDFADRAVTLFDHGDTKICVSTWPLIGRAVAALLSLPITPGRQGDEMCLEKFRNEVVYVNSFTVSQRDMLDSVMRVTDTKLDDWKIVEESAVARYSDGVKESKEGKRAGFAKVLYTRVFYSDGCGDFEQAKGTLNNLLGLPQESLDEATRSGIERAKTGNWADKDQQNNA